jgi:macrodomain Ter protein organizer (MatP/YcbG family)|tara:strand:+ start:356 stop:535 length:180 start_codon:yes stop_codon:yes gene_type:complete
MADTKEYKSVAVDLPTYSRLKKLAEDEHRNVRQQISKLAADAYENKYVSKGLGSTKQDL